jgi:hypothetical protein
MRKINMTAAESLEQCYDLLFNALVKLALLPETYPVEIFSGSRTKQNKKTTGSHNSISAAVQLAAYVDAQQKAILVSCLLSPILIPLKIATFVLAGALALAALITQIITYPIAYGVDAVSESLSPSSFGF